MMAELITEIFQVCIIPLLGVLTAYAVKFIKAKAEQIKLETEDATADKYIDMITSTITTCVISTNQVYVSTLKKQGKFDAEAQKEAFNMTLSAVKEILSDESKQYISTAFGDLNAYLTNQIEATVSSEK